MGIHPAKPTYTCDNCKWGRATGMVPCIKCARTIANVSRQIIDTGRLALDALKLRDEHNDADLEIPKMLEGVA